MNKEIRIINYVFKIKDVINLISIEHYHNFQDVLAKIKFIYKNEYFEKEVLNINSDLNKISLDDSSITNECLEIKIDKHQIKLYIDNKELLEEYKKSNIKNNYKLINSNIFRGKIDEEEISGKILVDYEVLKNIPDEYYKMYTIDFINFNGIFNFLFHEGKGIHLNLTYKDESYKNKKVLNVRKINFFKICNIKLKCSGHYLWTIKFNKTKTFKSLPSIIPFLYIKGNATLNMKKHLFQSDFNANSSENMIITYHFN